MKRIIYLRVSKKELNEKTQTPVIVKHFNLKDYGILAETISGYDLKKQEKREQLNALRELVEKGELKEIYVYSLERIYRNIELLLEFYFFCRVHGVEIYSYLQPEINNFKGDSPINVFLKYQSVLVNGFMGQQESYLISERTKKSFHINEDGERVSYKGNKSGRSLEIDGHDAETIRYLYKKGHTYRDIQHHIKYENKKKVSLGTIGKVINKELF